MQNETENVVRFWPIILAGLATLIWFIRLEAKVLNLAANHKDERDALQKNFDRLWQKFDELQNMQGRANVSLAKIEGRLENNNTDKNN